MDKRSNPDKAEVVLQLFSGLEMVISQYTPHYLGYPANQNFDTEALIEWWQKSAMSKVFINEVGDPSDPVSLMLSTRELEREVLVYFSQLYALPNYWGYITPGGTQGNEQGLFMGREYLKQYGKPIFYYSKESHYSISTVARILDVEKRVIPCKPNGEMDIDAFAEQLIPERPALININIGTTFKGAIDPFEAIFEILDTAPIPAWYAHADAALFGGYLPFIADPKAPKIDFTRHPFCSIAVSGHKFWGSPIPLGLFLTRKAYAEGMNSEIIEYVSSNNLVIPCSRSSLNTMLLYWTIHTVDKERFTREAEEILENARYLHGCFQERNYPSWLNSYSNTVYFRSPKRDLYRRWSLPRIHCKDLGDLSHIVVMQHATKERLDRFLSEL